MHVELHTGLADHPMLISGIGMGSTRQEVRIGTSLTLPTLAPDELFAYLCVHGASSAWFRLKWAADLAALLAGNDPAENGRLYRRSQKLRAGRAADIALLLIHHLFDTALEPELVQKLQAKRANRWLMVAAERSLAGRAVATELSELRLGTAWMHAFQLGLMPGTRFKALALGRDLSPRRRALLKTALGRRSERAR
jgi:hypothetical protein